MDRHSATPFERQHSVILALIGIWYTNSSAPETEVILPYDQYMHRFPAFVQQGNMESNGKSVDRAGRRVGYGTGRSSGATRHQRQHAFYQLIHQGDAPDPGDFWRRP